MSRLDIAMDALLAIFMSRLHIVVGPIPAQDIKNFVQQSVLYSMNTHTDDRFCELFWMAAKMAVNRVLEAIGRDILEEDELEFLFRDWRDVFRQRRATSAEE